MSTMRAIVFDKPGGPEVLHIGQAPKPDLKPKDIRIGVTCTAVNRAETLQREGTYPPPPGASELLGLECAGKVIEVGPEVTKWKVGDRVMALLAGGGYAEEVAVDEGSVMPIPDALTDEDAGGFMETYLTAFLNIWQVGALPEHGTVLVHGGGSGIGTSAIAIAKELGNRILITAGSKEKCDQCASLGADAVINYKEGDFVDAVKKLEEAVGNDKNSKHTPGVNMVLDVVGAPYLAKNVEVLAADGRLVIIGWLGGMQLKDWDMMPLVKKRIHIIGSTLRARSEAFKAQLIEDFLQRLGPALEAGRLKPIVDCVMPLEDAAKAHQRMADSHHFGKIVLRVQPQQKEQQKKQ